jgi:protein-disulfide isomerase
VQPWRGPRIGTTGGGATEAVLACVGRGGPGEAEAVGGTRAAWRAWTVPALLLLAACVAEPGGEEERTEPVDPGRIGHVDGVADAPVTVVEFADFGCPFCAMFERGTYPELRREFVETGRVRWVFVPFVAGASRNSAEAVRAGECAGEQGRFEAMKARLYGGQNEWRSRRRAGALFAGYARESGLDEARFASCYREDRGGARTRAGNRAARAAGVRATPSFLIDGRLVEGAPPLEHFRAILGRLSEAEP